MDEDFLWHGKLVFRPLLQNLRWHSNQIGFEDKTVEKLFDAADAGSQGEEMTIALGEHALHVLDQVDTVLANVIQPADKWGNMNGRLGLFRRGIDARDLSLRKAQGHAESNALLDSSFRRFQTFRRARKFDVSIGHPRKHFATLLESGISAKRDSSEPQSETV